MNTPARQLSPLTLMVAAFFAAAALAALTSFFYMVATKVASNDTQLLAAYDRQVSQQLAAMCGSAGMLVLDPQSNQHYCLYRNPDGATMSRPVDLANL